MRFIRCLLGIHHFRWVKGLPTFENETDKRPIYVILIERCRCCGKIRQTRIG